MNTDRLTGYLVPVLLFVGIALAAVNWYVAPEDAKRWASAMVVVGCMALAWRAAVGRASSQPPVRQATETIIGGVVFGVLIIIASLLSRLGGALVTPAADGLVQRMPMILLGLFFVFTGNAMPKMLTPLSALQCDPARVQAMQRFAGWTWVLMGFAYSAVWAVAPRSGAKPLSTLIVLFGTLAVFARVLRLWRARHTEA